MSQPLQDSACELLQLLNVAECCETPAVPPGIGAGFGRGFDLARPQTGPRLETRHVRSTDVGSWDVCLSLSALPARLSMTMTDHRRTKPVCLLRCCLAEDAESVECTNCKSRNGLACAFTRTTLRRFRPRSGLAEAERFEPCSARKLAKVASQHQHLGRSGPSKSVARLESTLGFTLIDWAGHASLQMAA